MAEPPLPAFAEASAFIENPFERRFQGLLREAGRKRSWHVITAVQGSGKSWGIADLVQQSGMRKSETGETHIPVLAIRAPKNRSTENALGNALAAAFGTVPHLPWALRRTWLVGAIAQARSVLLIVDDAQDLSPAHLLYLKELTDNLAAPPYGQHLGVCLVTASGPGVMPLQELFNRPEIIWRQFRRRLDKERPFCRVLGHSAEEVVELCAGYEDLYRPQFPRLALCRWAPSIYAWLTDPVLDPEGRQRVTMDHMNKLVVLALETAAALRLSDVTGDLLRAAAEILTLKPDYVTEIDGEPPADHRSAVEVA